MAIHSKKLNLVGKKILNQKILTLVINSKIRPTWKLSAKYKKFNWCYNFFLISKPVYKQKNQNNVIKVINV